MFCECGGNAKKYGRYCEDATAQRWQCRECGRLFVHDRRESNNHNFIAGPQRNELKNLLVAGVPVRAAARAIGVAHNTATRYYRLWAIDAACPCGEPSTHMGWCSWRLQMAPKRQSWLDQQWARRVSTDVGALVRKATAAAEANGHSIGTWVWGADTNAGLWPWTKCKVCGNGLSITQRPVFEEAPKVEGKALESACVTPEQREDHRQQVQEIKAWRTGKRILAQVKRGLRDHSQLPSEASSPAATSRK